MTMGFIKRSDTVERTASVCRATASCESRKCESDCIQGCVLAAKLYLPALTGQGWDRRKRSNFLLNPSVHLVFRDHVRLKRSKYSFGLFNWRIRRGRSQG